MSKILKKVGSPSMTKYAVTLGSCTCTCTCFSQGPAADGYSKYTPNSENYN